MRVPKPPKATLQRMSKAMSTNDISKVYGVTENTARNWLRSYDIPRPGRRPNINSKAVAAYIGIGLDVATIARLMDYSKFMIYKTIRDNNIQKEKKRMNLAKFEIIGRLTKDPEIRKTQSGLMVARFPLAVNRKDAVDFYNIATFDKKAEFASKFLHKGTLVRVEGAMRTNKKDNVVYTDYIADSIMFMESKQEKPQEFVPINTDEEGDLPF